MHEEAQIFRSLHGLDFLSWKNFDGEDLRYTLFGMPVKYMPLINLINALTW